MQTEPSLDRMIEPHPDRRFAIDSWVRIKGERKSVFKVKGYAKDGSVTLYGGDADPNAHRGFRNVMPDNLVPAKSPDRA